MSARIFIGRSEELQLLKECWQRAKTGKPQLAILLGETGLGKTRVIQEFYSWLSQDDTEDPDGYWPATLTLDSSLAVNPRPEEVNNAVPIPWLWWGMRFHNPGDRNRATIERSPFEAEDPALLIHAAAIVKRRDIKACNISAAKALATVFADIASLGLLSATHSISEMLIANKRGRAAKTDATATAADLVAKRSEELGERSLAALHWFLDPKVTDAPTVPVVLIIDDAQWSDPATANVLRSIMVRASQRQWQLLVVATHWEKEWEEDATEPNTFRETFDAWSAYSPDSTTILRLRKLAGESLEPIIQARLPGILQEHREKLLNEADGNPRALEEMIGLLVNKPKRYFKDEDPSGPLSRAGVQRLADLEGTDLFHKVRERFLEIEEEIQDLLSTGTLFGPAFLRPFVVDVLLHSSEDTDWAYTASAIAHLARAEKVHAMVQQLSERGHEFQQRVYHLVAKQFLDTDQELKDTRQATLVERINVWIDSDELHALSDDEKELFYSFVVDHYLESPERESALASTAGKSFNSLLWLLDGRGATAQIVKWWQKLFSSLEAVDSGFFRDAAFSAPLITRVLEFRVFDAEIVDRTLSVFDSAITASASDDSHYFHPKVGIVSARGFIAHVFHGNPSLATTYFHQALALSHQCINHFGETPCRLRDLSSALFEVGVTTLDAKDDPALGQPYLEDALALDRRIIKCFGETPDRMSALSASLDYLGVHLNNVKLDAETAGTYFEEALALNREIIERFGETPRRLSNLCFALDRFGGHAFKTCWDYDTGRACFEEAHATIRQIIERFGETPDRIRNLSKSLARLGDVALKMDRDPNAARNLYEEALSLDRQIIERFGETPARLERLTISLGRLGDFAFDVDDDAGIARTYFEERLLLRRRIIERFGETPERLRDLRGALSHFRMHVLKPDDRETAKLYVHEAHAISKKLGDTAL